MDILLFIFNNPIYRLVMGLIICATIGSPFINEYTSNPLWLIAAIIIYCVLIVSVIIGYEFKGYDPFLIVLILIGIAAAVYIGIVFV